MIRDIDFSELVYQYSCYNANFGETTHHVYCDVNRNLFKYNLNSEMTEYYLFNTVFNEVLYWFVGFSALTQRPTATYTLADNSIVKTSIESGEKTYTFSFTSPMPQTLAALSNSFTCTHQVLRWSPKSYGLIIEYFNSDLKSTRSLF